MIEDDPLYSGAIEAVLSDNYTVSVHGEAPAIDDVAALSPGAILLDNTLPGMSGSDFLAALKADERTTNIPVIMMSGNHDVLRKDPQLEAACAAFLGKPFSLDQLSDTVRNVLSS